MTDYIQIVRDAVAEFQPPLSCPEGDEHGDEEMKALATRRAAYRINQVDPSIGLLSKPSGNNSMGYSTDLIVHRTTGEFADIMSTRPRGDGTREVVPLWLPNPPSQDPAWLARWRQPTAELAGLESGDTVGGDTGGGGRPEPNLESRLLSLEEARRAQALSIAEMQLKLDEMQQEISRLKIQSAGHQR
jgi:hypothetical protein